jgi:hypothetical protein
MCRPTGRRYRILRRGRKWSQYAGETPAVEMPPLPTKGPINELRIQTEVVWYICVRLGQDRLLDYADRKNVGLKDIFNDVRQKYNNATDRTLYRWLNKHKWPPLAFSAAPVLNT